MISARHDTWAIYIVIATVTVMAAILHMLGVI
jgi:hypothetical protein